MDLTGKYNRKYNGNQHQICHQDCITYFRTGGNDRDGIIHNNSAIYSTLYILILYSYYMVGNMHARYIHTRHTADKYRDIGIHFRITGITE